MSVDNNKQTHTGDNTMSNYTPFPNDREAMLTLMEVGNAPEQISVFTYAGRLMVSLKEKTITAWQYEGLCQMMERYCKTEGIETTAGNISLF